jgi:peptidoglycan/LPS O-acetylase OafA/YrhL
MPNKNKHITVLDPLRGAAILFVFLYHCLGAGFARDHLSWDGLFTDFSFAGGQRVFTLLFPLTFGYLGVALFFVVSGFCIHLSYARNPAQGFGAFYARRFFRIYPPYLVVLIVMALTLPGKALNWHLSADWWQFLSHATLCHNMHSDWLFGINPSFWSIAMEVEIYLLYPILIWSLRGLGWTRTLILLGVFEVSLRGFTGWYITAHDVTEVPFLFKASAYYYWFSWSLGARLADAFIRDERLPFAGGSLVLWSALTVICAMVKPLSEFTFTTAAVLTAIGMARLLQTQKLLLPDFLSAHLAKVGLWSYSIYLVHQPILIMVSNFLRGMWNLNSILLFVICVSLWPAILLLSKGLFHYLEMPSMELGKFILKGRKAPKKPDGDQSVGEVSVAA